MNEYAKRLVTALRSGDYKQGHGRLRGGDGESFCCLGVACDLIQGELGVTWSSSDRDGLRYTFLGRVSKLPEKVRKLYGFTSYFGDYRKKDGELCSLSDLNDNGSSFEEIANFIESEPEGLFE